MVKNLLFGKSHLAVVMAFTELTLNASWHHTINIYEKVMPVVCFLSVSYVFRDYEGAPLTPYVG